MASNNAGGNKSTENPDHAFTFASLSIPSSHVFTTTPLSYAFVNLKPVVPGHVLVSPRRLVPRLAGLTPGETADLFSLATRVAAAVEPHFGASSITLAVQDGPDAGQTVPHVHVHVLPRKGGDFPKNDDVYSALEGKTTPGTAGNQGGGAINPDAPRPARTPQEMAAEAAVLRTLF